MEYAGLRTELTPELAFKIGRFGGYVLTKDTDRPKVIIGRDTRISGHMLEGALVAGLLSTGAEVMRLGVISTPCCLFNESVRCTSRCYDFCIS